MLKAEFFATTIGIAPEDDGSKTAAMANLARQVPTAPLRLADPHRSMKRRGLHESLRSLALPFRRIGREKAGPVESASSIDPRRPASPKSPCRKRLFAT